MLRFCLLWGALLACRPSLFAQDIELKGKVQDSTQAPLAQASVVLLQAADSVLHKFSLSNEEGSFTLKNIKAGNYLLQISYLGYETLYQLLSLQATEKYKDLGLLTLQTKDQVLRDVVISQERIPVQIKGDTVEYDPEAFKVKEQAVVEDLLKKLPGIQVEKDGTIKAQGEEVKKVLVDGKPFFGDDPKIATKNLPAGAVGKVQLFDELSEMAQFTGVDDGNREKTLNFELKPDRKGGAFGNLGFGLGSQGRYSAKLNANRFDKTYQVSGIGAYNNVNESDFTLNDYLRFYGGLQALQDPQALRQALSRTGLGQQAGISQLGTGGLNWNLFPQENTQWTFSYFFNNDRNVQNNLKDRLNFSGEDLFSSQESLSQLSRSKEHRFRSSWKYRPHEKQEISLKTNLRYSHQKRNADRLNQSFDNSGAVLGQQALFSLSERNLWDIRQDFAYRRKLRKKGRSFTLEGYLSYFPGTADDEVRPIDSLSSTESEVLEEEQLQEEARNSLQYELGITYTEPLFKKNLLQYRLKWGGSQEDFEKSFFEFPNSDNMPVLNEALSQSLDNTYRYYRGGFLLFMPQKKGSLAWGLELQDSKLKGRIGNAKEDLRRSFFYVLPELRWKYQMRGGKRLDLSYQSSVKEPTLDQLQPTINNLDPLRVYQGNPNLNVEYHHTVRASYLHFNQFNFSSLFFNFLAQYTQDKIQNAREIDAFLVQTVQPLNVDYELLLNARLSFSRPIRPWGIETSLSLQATMRQGIQILNGEENTINQSQQQLDVSFGNRKKEKIDLKVGVKLDLNQARYANNAGLNQQYLQPEWYHDMSWDLGERFNLAYELTYTQFRGDAFMGTPDRLLGKLSLSYNLFKARQGQVLLEVFDVFDQNRGIQRQSQANFLEEQRFNVLGRYIMIRFSYAFKRFGIKRK